MTAPVPEEDNAALDLTEAPDDEHPSEAPGETDDADSQRQEENAETSLDQPST